MRICAPVGFVWAKRVPSGSCVSRASVRVTSGALSKHSLLIAANVLERNFSPETRNRVWTADPTCFWTDQGWLHLAVVLHLFNRELVGWAINHRMSNEIVIDSLTMA